MLIPENASRHVRLKRLAALGLALPASGARPASPSAVRAILKSDDIGGPSVLWQEDPYSEVLIQSINFAGGPYLISPGSGEHTVADLENLIDAAFRDTWMPDEMRGRARQAIRGLLIVSDMVLRRAGLTRGTPPGGSARTPVDVPGATRLKKLADATFFSHSELDAHGSWLRMVVDAFALDPGELTDPCANDVMDDRLLVLPFLRLPDGYRVSAPLDLAITIRFHLMRFALEADSLVELGMRSREAVYMRLRGLLSREADIPLIEQNHSMRRHLLRVDERRDIHLIIATDSLRDWNLDVWGVYDTSDELDRIERLISPDVRKTYSTADEVLHLVVVDSPGRSAFWGVPNVSGADPVLIVRSDDLEVMMHQESDGALGLLLFAQAVDKRAGMSMSTSTLDEFAIYVDHEKSFYLSDEDIPTFTMFQAGDGMGPRKEFFSEVDRHGVIPPMENPPILEARRRYKQDAAEIFIIEPHGKYVGYVVEFAGDQVFITIDLNDVERVGVELELLECVAYWVRECVVRGEVHPSAETSEVVIQLADLESWRKVGSEQRSAPAVRSHLGDRLALELTGTFVALLQDEHNTAEREIVSALLANLFDVPPADLSSVLDAVAPLGSKRMISASSQANSPDMLAEHLPWPLTGHAQVAAQLLDDLGEWLRSPTGGRLQRGKLVGQERVDALNASVRYLFGRLQNEIASYDQRELLDFLIAQNESLAHDSKFNAITLATRLACFGEQSHTVAELVQHRKANASAQRANRFLIEFVAAQAFSGTSTVEVLDYYRMLAISEEIIDRASTSDFLKYEIADFDVSILGSGRLGVNRDEPVILAMDTYAEQSGVRSVQEALSGESEGDSPAPGLESFLAASDDAMRAEFGFTFSDLQEVCGGLLDLASADKVTRVRRSVAVAEIAAERHMTESLVSAVVDKITLSIRPSFIGVDPDSYPWRFNRDMSYVRRPLVQQGDDLVFGFRSIYRLGLYWADNILSGRLQGRANTQEMRHYISEARGKINDDFARSVAVKLSGLGMETRMSVKKIGTRRISDVNGSDLGDVDILAAHAKSRSILAIEAKDFEIARTPAEMSNELKKLFLGKKGKKGKKSTVELHGNRIEWLVRNIDDVVASFYPDDDGTLPWRVVGAVVTSDRLITPLVSSSSLPVISLGDLRLDSLGLAPSRHDSHAPGKGGKRRPSRGRTRRRRA